MLSVSQKKKTTKKEEEPLALFSDLLCAIVRLSQAARKKSFRNVFSASRQNNIGVLLYHCSEIHVHGGKKGKKKKCQEQHFRSVIMLVQARTSSFCWQTESTNKLWLRVYNKRNFCSLSQGAEKAQWGTSLFIVWAHLLGSCQVQEKINK